MSSPPDPQGNGVPCAGGVIRDGAGRLLLVLRGNEPGRGSWSVPGGRVEPGEDERAAVAREVREETGLDVEVGALLGRVVRGPYAIADYACTVTGGALAPGDDAVACRWAAPEDLPRLRLVEGLLDFLEATSA